MSNDVLIWLQNWFLEQADGEWEHAYGIKIGPLDNPGWHITIDLAETLLAEKPFQPIRTEVSESNWMTCRVQDKKFEGFCGPELLRDALEVFRRWVQN